MPHLQNQEDAGDGYPAVFYCLAKRDKGKGGHVRRFFRVTGWIFALIGSFCLLLEVLSWHSTGLFAFRQGGALWYSLDPASLNLLQAVIERYIWPPLWDPVLLAVLRMPAVPLFAGLAILSFVGARLCGKNRG